MPRWNDKEYISLSWDGTPDYHCIAGHHDRDTVSKALMAEIEFDISNYKVYHDYARATGIGFYLFTKPKKGRIPVSVIYLR